MVKISSPLLPCARRLSATERDIIRKKRVVNCELGECLYRGASHSSQCYLEVKDIAIQLNHIHFGVSELNTVRSRVSNPDLFYEGFIITCLTGKVIQILIIIDPESNIPGLVILPTVIGDIKSIGLVGSSHLEESWFGWSLHYRDTLKAPGVSVYQRCVVISEEANLASSSVANS